MVKLVDLSGGTSSLGTNELLYRLVMMDNHRKNEEISSLIEDERRRGRRPRDSEAKKLRKQRLEALREILHLRREEDFVAAIRALGHGDDPAELAEALKIWRAFASSKRP